MLGTFFDLGAPSSCVSCRARGAVLCLPCLRGVRPARVQTPVAGVDRIVAAWSYEEGARALVLALKARGLRAAAGPLAAAIGDAVVREGLVASALTWVPGRAGDIRRRGFDHAEVLARGVAAGLGLPVFGLLRRSGARPHQRELTAAQRWRNLEGAFAARSCPHAVAIVDDLVTTGATARACALALRDAGASRVELLAGCRA